MVIFVDFLMTKNQKLQELSSEKSMGVWPSPMGLLDHQHLGLQDRIGMTK